MSGSETMGTDRDSSAAHDRHAAHELTLMWRDDQEETIPVGVRETVLDAAERAGVSLPFGCRTGACTTCTGQVLDGCVDHPRPPRGLKARHLDSGYALLCIAELRTDCHIQVGVDVQADLISYPRK
jgi:ferredoxin